MSRNLLPVILSLFVIYGCVSNSQREISVSTGLVPSADSIQGRMEYLGSPYVTAGDRLYLVGHQDGTFPDLGWHVKGEMGGIWAHPVKLMDGFNAKIIFGDSVVDLPPAASFVNYPYGNSLRFDPIRELQISRTQFVPDSLPGLMVSYRITNEGNRARTFTFAFSGTPDLRPVWLGERTGMVNDKDSSWYSETHRAMISRDLSNEWYSVFGSELIPRKHEISSDGQLIATMHYRVSLQPGETAILPFTIAGSEGSLDDVIAVYQRVRDHAPILIQEKKTRYETIAETAKLSVPDSSLEQTFRWLKYNTDWLIRDVPGVGRGLSAGIPDYPWWFGADSEYALQGALMTGRRDIVYETIGLIASISDSVNGNGRIVHEVSSNGAVFNPGNINETPQFASLIWKVYNWTGDRKFLEKYYPLVKQGLEWLDEHDEDNNGRPDGFGMMEIHGLDSEMIDVAAYTQKAWADAAKMAEVLGLPEAEDYRQKAGKLAEDINRDFWVPSQNSYADFIGTVGDARELIRHAIHRADSLNKPWAVKELQQTLGSLEGLKENESRAFVVHHNWVVNTPMETGVADKDKAMKALTTASHFTNPFGMYVTGIDRDEKAGEEAGSFVTNKKIFSYIGAVMTLPTGVQAVAENNYGRPDEALDYLQRMVRSFSYALPGSMYEVSPDYGMIVQAWNIYSFAVPVIEQFFGIYPDAARDVIVLSPLMPEEWPEAALENVPVLRTSLSLNYASTDQGMEWKIYQTNKDQPLELRFPEGKYSTWVVNGNQVTPEILDGYSVFKLTNADSVTVTLTE